MPSTTAPGVTAAILPSRRHAFGRARLASCLNYWINASPGLSHQQAAAIADWALGESGWLISSQLSHLRNGKISRPGLRYLEALAAINQAIWRWHVHGQEACLQTYGPYTVHKVDPAVLDAATWLHHPDDKTDPLGFADFVEIFTGYLELPYVGVALSPSESTDLSQELAALLEHEIAAKGWGMRDAMTNLLAAYPVSDPHRRSKLQAVVLGQANYTSDELEQELMDLAHLFSNLRGLPPGSIQPAALHAELARNRQRS